MPWYLNILSSNFLDEYPQDMSMILILIQSWLLTDFIDIVVLLSGWLTRDHDRDRPDLGRLLLIVRLHLNRVLYPPATLTKIHQDHQFLLRYFTCSSWAGKRGGRNMQGFSAWAGKRSGRQNQGFSSWAGKRAPFNAWAGKRSGPGPVYHLPEYERFADNPNQEKQNKRT